MDKVYFTWNFMSTLSVFSTNIMLEFRIFAVIKKGSLNDIVIAKVAMTLEKWKANTQFQQENIVDLIFDETDFV